MRGLRGGVTISREPDSSTGGGRKGTQAAAGRGRGTGVPVSGAKRRRGEGEGVSSTGGQSGDGPRRTKVGGWPEERRYVFSLSRPVKPVCKSYDVMMT